MSDIYDTILEKYGIDINKENILKLYKIQKAELTSQELQDLIESTRKRWEQSVNGANEKFARRDRERLKKADKYEKILRDKKLRKELFDHYQNEGKEDPEGAKGGSERDVSFAREYFTLLKTSKNITTDDIDFFFKFYREERKHKKAILEMLRDELKYINQGINVSLKHKDYEEETEEDIDDDRGKGKKKKSSRPLIVNLFEETTVLKLRKSQMFFEDAALKKTILGKYPEVRDGMFEFLRLKEQKDAGEFLKKMTERSKEVYAVRQEMGEDYIPLVDFFNTMQEVAGCKDVIDNFEEFKLLIKYPELTSYMFSFVLMKKETLEGMANVAKKNYAFRDDADFILNYYVPVYDNFGITNRGIGDILDRAQKKAGRNKFVNFIDERFGRKNGGRMPPLAEVIHFLVYWPIFICYFMLELAITFLNILYYLTVPVFFGSIILENLLFPRWFGLPNFGMFNPFNNEELRELLLFIYSKINNGFEFFIMSITVLIPIIAIYVIPAVMLAYICHGASQAKKTFDWKGYERSFQFVLDTIRERTRETYNRHKKKLLLIKLPAILINIICVILIVMGFRYIHEKKQVGKEGNRIQTETEAPETVEMSSETGSETETADFGSDKSGNNVTAG